MKKANKLEFYYLPSFYEENSGAKMALVRGVGDGAPFTNFGGLASFMDGRAIVIRPANKKELRKADQELLELLKKGE